MTRPTHVALLALALALAPVPRSGAQELDPPSREQEERQTFLDRKSIPGHYTVGLYADEEGRTRELKVGSDQETVDLWIGLSGDDFRVFSGCVFRLELPVTLSLAGPITWRSIPGLEQDGSAEGLGMEVGFPKSCQRMRGDLPAILGRVTLRIRSDFEEAELAPQPHQRWGLSVELCSDEMAWPKPYAEPVSVRIERKRGLWESLRRLFH